MIYRLAKYNDMVESKGFEYYASKSFALKRANQIMADFPSFTVEILGIVLPKTKKDLVFLMDKFAAHPNNG